MRKLRSILAVCAFFLLVPDALAGWCKPSASANACGYCKNDRDCGNDRRSCWSEQAPVCSRRNQRRPATRPRPLSSFKGWCKPSASANACGTCRDDRDCGNDRYSCWTEQPRVCRKRSRNSQSTIKPQKVRRGLRITDYELKAVRRIANQGECREFGDYEPPAATTISKISIGSDYIVFLYNCGMIGAGPNGAADQVLFVVRLKNSQRLREANILMNGQIRNDGTILSKFVETDWEKETVTEHTTYYRLNRRGKLKELRTDTNTSPM